jgi:hypothetical protein
MKNIKTLISISICIMLFLGESFAQNYNWTKVITADDQRVDSNQKIFEGNNSSYYVAMRFFGSIAMGTPPKKKKEKLPTISSGKNYGLYFAKYNSDGTEIWNKVFETGGGGTQWSTLMTAITDAVEDSQGNIYITGRYEKGIDFGNGVELKSKGLNDMFIVRLTSEGTAAWAKSAGGISTKNWEPGGYKVSVDADNNVIVMGKVAGWGDKTKATDKSGTAFFDGEKLDVSIMGAVVVAKIAQDGTTNWVKLSTGMPTFTQMDLDADGNIYMGGNVMHLGGWEDVSITSNGLNDMAMMKMDKNGKMQWYKQFGYGSKPLKAGDTDTDVITGLAVSPTGDITISGIIKSGGKLDGKKVTGKGFNDMVTIIAGFDTDGNVGNINTFTPGKSGMVMIGNFKSDNQGGLLTNITDTKSGYGSAKIKAPGVYRFSNSGDMESVMKISGRELKGYAIIARDFIPCKNNKIMTLGNLYTLSGLAAATGSSGMKKYWDKTYKIPKGNAETGIVYSLYSE